MSEITLEEIAAKAEAKANKINKVGEKDNTLQKALVSVFGLVALVLSLWAFYLFRTRYI